MFSSGWKYPCKLRRQLYWFGVCYIYSIHTVPWQSRNRLVLVVQLFENKARIVITHEMHCIHINVFRIHAQPADIGGFLWNSNVIYFNVKTLKHITHRVREFKDKKQTKHAQTSACVYTVLLDVIYKHPGGIHVFIGVVTACQPSSGRQEMVLPSALPIIKE